MTPGRSGVYFSLAWVTDPWTVVVLPATPLAPRDEHGRILDSDSRYTNYLLIRPPPVAVRTAQAACRI